MQQNYLLLFLFFTTSLFAQNQYPEIDNLTVVLDENTQIVTISYDLFDTENELMDIHFLVSNDGGISYTIDTQNATGDVGTSIASGNDKNISWDASGLLATNEDYQVKLVADDRYPIDIQSIVDQVDSNRIYDNLTFIEGVRHRTANPTHLEAIKDSIETRFTVANLDTYRSDFTFGNYTAQNIIGRQEGLLHADTSYIIDGHFDTVNDSPGADDNGSAVAGMLEVLRVLAPYRFNKSVRYIGFDLEESGLLGAFDYNNNGIPDGETTKGVFNLEMIGYYSEEANSQVFPNGFELLFPEAQAMLEADDYRGNFITNIGDGNSVELMSAYNEATLAYVPALKVIPLEAPAAWAALTPDLGRSDHATFWLNGIPALMLTDGSEFRNPYYHSPNDVKETLNATFMSDVVKSVVATVAEVAGIRHSTAAISDFSVTTTTNHSLDCVFQLSPIPASDQLHLMFDVCAAPQLSLRLYDLSGQLMLEQDIPVARGSQMVDLSSFVAGVYFLKLSDGHREVVERIVVE